MGKDRSSLQRVSDALIPRRHNALLVLWLNMFDSHSVVSHLQRAIGTSSAQASLCVFCIAFVFKDTF